MRQQAKFVAADRQDTVKRAEIFNPREILIKKSCTKFAEPLRRLLVLIIALAKALKNYSETRPEKFSLLPRSSFVVKDSVI